MKKPLAILCLLLLTACTPRQIVKTEYIYPTIPATPAAPAFYSVEWTKCGAGYCLTEEQAKNLLKNMAIQEDYDKDLRTILDGLKRK